MTYPRARCSVITCAMHARDPFPIARSAMKAIALVPDSHVIDDIIMAITL